MDFDRRILIVDTEEGALQQLALDLMGRHFEVHYAADLDEAQLLAREVDGLVNAVLWAPGPEIERVPDVARRFGVEPQQLIPTGPRPSDRVVAALAHHGVRWHLWDDPPDESIRFVISGVIHEHDPFELRYHLRVPTRFPARFSCNGRKSETTIRDIGLGGACLFGGAIGEQGEPGTLAFTLDGREVELPTRMAWSAIDENESLSVGGVAFLEVAPEAGEAIDAVRRAAIARHRIAPRR